MAGKIKSITEKYIMISYQWDYQETVLKLKERLEKHGYKVWIDVEQMSDSTLACMADAVENSEIVLLCFSKAYKESKNCQTEGEYTDTKKKPFIPLLLESGYKADGWLGALLGTRLYIDFSQAENFEAKLAELVRTLDRKCPALKSQNNISQKMEKLTTRQIESESTKPTGKKETHSKPQNKNSAQRMKTDMLTDKAKLHISKSNYEGAVSVLEDPCVLESDYFVPKLMLAECYLHLTKHHKAINMIGDVKKTIMMSSGLTPNDIKEYANGFIESSFYVRAIILLRIASDMYETSSLSPDDVINGIYSCVDKMDDAITPMIKAGSRLRVIGVEFGIEYMRESYDQLKTVKRANPGNKAKLEAKVCNSIGFNLQLGGEKEKSIKIRQTGVAILERQFGPDAAKYAVHGRLLQNLGCDHYNLKKYSQAKSYFMKAIESREKATDYVDESRKQKDIERSKTDLKDTRAKLVKK